MEDEDMQYCKICLVTDCKMFSSPSISEAYSQFVQVQCNYKLYVCYECKHLLTKCQEFRSKCIMALNVLSSIQMDHSKINKRLIKDIDRKHYKLESKLSRSCILLVCNSNEQNVLLEPNLDWDRIETDIKPDTCKDEKPEVKFEMEVEVFSDVETQDAKYPYEIFPLNHAPNNIDPEIKPEQKCLLDSKKTKCVSNKKTTLKRVTKKRNSDMLPMSDVSTPRTNPRNCMMQMLQKYVTTYVMTPSEAKEQMLLKKETDNYKMNSHKCDLCYKGFTTESTYNNHMKQHSPNLGTEECDFCHLLFRTRHGLMKHVDDCHKYKVTCKYCPYICFSLAQAKNHIAVHKGETYTCQLCGKNFRYLNTLSNHKRIKHPEQVCAHCGSMFASLLGLKSHKNRAHKQDSTELLGPKCEECDVQFATETAWKRHLVLSSKHTVSNGCEKCGETFYTAQELKSHAKQHPQRLAIAQYLKRRAKRPAVVVCKLCDKRLDTNAEHKEHMKSAHPNVTTAKKTVKRQVEEDNMQYICELCGKGFKTSLLLNYHTNKHTGELPYECDQCDKKYTTPSTLYVHKAKHHSGTGAPRFKCDVCKKDFHFKSILRSHMIMVHLDIRRYQCKICHKLFCHKYEVKRHMEYTHLKKPWPKRDRTKRKN